VKLTYLRIIRNMYVDKTRIKIRDTHHCNTICFVFVLKLAE